MGADPVAYAIAHASWLAGTPVDAFTVRKQPKEHGTGRRIEGNFREGSRALVIEDVITSGGSALQAVDAVEHEGGSVVGVLAVIVVGRGEPVLTPDHPGSPWRLRAGNCRSALALALDHRAA